MRTCTHAGTADLELDVDPAVGGAPARDLRRGGGTHRADRAEDGSRTGRPVRVRLLLRSGA